MQYHLSDQGAGGWFVRLLGAIVSVIVMVALFFLGITVFAAVAGLALLVFLVLAARVWWLRRKLGRGSPRDSRSRRQASRQGGGGVTLEGEYEDRSRDR